MRGGSGVRGDWQVVLAAGLAVLTAGVVSLVARTGDPTTADSYLSEVHSARVTLADGSEAVVRDGMRVPDGATVTTAAGGAAVLSTAGRDVYLGPGTALTVTDGVTQRLVSGSAMVDGRDGPRLALGTRAGIAELPDGGLARFELGPVLRIGVFAKRVVLRPLGRQATTRVPTLYQLQAPYVGLPGAPTVLALTGDRWEQDLASDLVSADGDLTALAQGLAGPSASRVLLSAPVALRTGVASLADTGEQALSVALAQASRRDTPLADTFDFVAGARSEGGSWGVIAALVDARVSAVSALLDGLLPAPVAVAPPAGPFFLQPTASPTVSATGRPSPVPSRTPSPGPTTSSPSPGPSDVISQVLNTITRILGSPTPLPTLPKLLP